MNEDADGRYQIALATTDDVAAIIDLQDRNQPDRGGTLSARFGRAWFEKAIAAMPVIVARRSGTLVGYLVSSPLSANVGVSILAAMIAAYRGADDAYVYGPICVAAAERGNGVAGRMFAALRARLPGREGVLFIRRDNHASLVAHARLGMQEVAEFEHEGAALVVLSYVG